jgi:hypothetical protein
MTAKHSTHMSVEADVETELVACKELVPEEPAPDLRPLQARVKNLLAEERGLIASLRSLPTHQRVSLVLALSVLVTVGALLLTPRGDLAAYPAARMAITLAILFTVTAFASWRLLRPLHLPPPRRAGSTVLLVGGMLMPFVMSVLPLGHIGHPPGLGAEFVFGCMRCLLFGGALGLPVLILALTMRRAAVDGAAVAALAGVAAGLTGNLVLQVHCPITDQAHLLGGHALLLVVLAAAAWLWRRPRGAVS